MNIEGHNMAKTKSKKTTTKTKAKPKKKELTVEGYWKQRKVDYSNISQLIDMYPEGSEMSETAKELISLLDDHSFDDYDPKTNETNNVD